jgi:C1A family cysteine protease
LNVINYASKFGKTYRTVTELNKRARNLKANTGRREQSRKNNPLATFGDTPYSDWSEEEMSDLLGLRTDGVRPQLRQAKPVSGLTVEVAMGALDWAAAGNMHAVKNQGSCGSCAAFTAVGVIEAMVSIQNANAAPVALSVQQGLDCSTGNYSCNGGWMEKYFEFYSAGAMLASDYPYAMRDQACQQTSESTFAATADWSSFVWLD